MHKTPMKRDTMKVARTGVRRICIISVSHASFNIDGGVFAPKGIILDDGSEFKARSRIGVAYPIC